MQTHRTLRQAALERDGLTPEDAARESRRAMGNITLAVEDVRDVRRNRLKSCTSYFRPVGVLIAAGLTLGLASSLWVSKFVSPLFQVEARDPSTFVGAAAVLIAVSAIAAWVPAQRATRLDPAEVLRAE